MECVIEHAGAASRHYLERLRINLAKEGDDRLARELDEYDTLRFMLDWLTCVGAALLLTFFVRSLFLALVWNCLAIALAGALAVMVYCAIAEWLCGHYNRRFYAAVPENLRWCFRRMP
jgi:hypothetical protein